jgi:hypothetical protein
MDKNKLTSVKVNEELFEEFKVLCVRTKFSLQKLVDRSIHLYLTEDDYRKKLHNHTSLNLSGSKQS